MIYEVRQLMRLTYGSFVPVARHILRLQPVQGPGLEVLESEIRIEPAPAERTDGTDFFGNGITHFSVREPHNALSIESRAVIDLKPAPERAAASTPAWEGIRRAAASAGSLDALSPAHFLFPTRHVPIDDAIREYAQTSFTRGRPVLEATIDLMVRMRADFVYDRDATTVATPARAAFDLRRGVCQDFAHIMISGLRSLGLPAAYVSGYLRTDPRPGQARLQGADAMHAWVSVWCGEDAGWQGLDPTNALRAGIDHIPLGFGRDYSDVSPLDGVIVDAGSHSLAVAVDVAQRA
jgi:transglutaminase-like putative cysteine protease